MEGESGGRSRIEIASGSPRRAGQRSQRGDAGKAGAQDRLADQLDCADPRGRGLQKFWRISCVPRHAVGRRKKVGREKIIFMVTAGWSLWRGSNGFDTAAGRPSIVFPTNFYG